MPVYSTTISQQQTGISSGKSTYPNLKQGLQSNYIIELFNRNSLNPSGAPSYYSSGGVGTPVFNVGGTTSGNTALTIQTSAAANDNAYATAYNTQFTRSTYYVDPKSMVTIDIVFDTQQTANTQFFIGVSESSSLTSPTSFTTGMGVYYDSSGTGKFTVISKNAAGTVNSSNTNVAPVANQIYRLNIIWNGQDSGTVALFTSSNNATIQPSIWTQIGSTLTVSSLANGNHINWSYWPSFFLQTLTTSAAYFDIKEWEAYFQ